ncbi:O-antigen ligase family protein [Psychroserpens mesophilus]|uniref:O-antigen ligase family protein n=1 Tax=Psychroserpens mesophilus TaxID=325473 RepID=UPI003D649C96
MFFSPAISNICLGLSILIFVSGLISRKISFSFSKKTLKIYLLICTPFLLTFISFLNSYDTIYSLDFLWLRAPLFVLPLMILNLNNIEKKDIDYAFLLYVFAAFLATVISYVNAIKIYFEHGLFLDPNLTRDYITPIQHPYYGIFTLVAIITLYFYGSIIKQKKVRVFLLVFFSVGVVLSTSRTAILLLLLFLVYTIFSFFKNHKTYRLLVLGSLGVIVFLSVSNTVLKTKIINTLSYWDSPRAWLWDNSYKVIKYSNHKLTGTGIGDFYRIKRSPEKFIHSQRGTYGYNPHNQYLEFLITNGIFGLLYVFTMLYLLYISYRSKTVYTVMIVLIISVFSFTECIFNRQFGIQLYSFFLPVSLILATKKQ